jgi:hypothetical protein
LGVVAGAMRIEATRPHSGSSPDGLCHREPREVDGSCRCACDGTGSRPRAAGGKKQYLASSRRGTERLSMSRFGALVSLSLCRCPGIQLGKGGQGRALVQGHASNPGYVGGSQYQVIAGGLEFLHFSPCVGCTGNLSKPCTPTFQCVGCSRSGLFLAAGLLGTKHVCKGCCNTKLPGSAAICRGQSSSSRLHGCQTGFGNRVGLVTSGLGDMSVASDCQATWVRVPPDIDLCWTPSDSA